MSGNIISIETGAAIMLLSQEMDPYPVVEQINNAQNSTGFIRPFVCDRLYHALM